MSSDAADGRMAKTASHWAIARLTLAGTAVCIGVSLLLTYLLVFSDAISPLILAVAVPALIAAPLLGFIGLKMQELRGLRRVINRLATYDQTTGLMNGMALEAVVERRANGAVPHAPEMSGFLVVQIDNLSDINMRYGFHHGDEALRLAATAIRSAVRESDMLGRLGAAEFGVFLPGATEANARDVGERVRAAIAAISFAPNGDAEIWISTGGIVFDQDFGFGEMFRGAERQLASGRSKSGLPLSLAESPSLSHRTAH